MDLSIEMTYSYKPLLKTQYPKNTRAFPFQFYKLCHLCPLCKCYSVKIKVNFSFMLGTGYNLSNVAKGQFPLAKAVWIGTFCQIRAAMKCLWQNWCTFHNEMILYFCLHLLKLFKNLMWWIKIENIFRIYRIKLTKTTLSGPLICRKSQICWPMLSISI